MFSHLQILVQQVKLDLYRLQSVNLKLKQLLLKSIIFLRMSFIASDSDRAKNYPADCSEKTTYSPVLKALHFLHSFYPEND